MSHQIWHAFYYDRTGDASVPRRSEVIEAASEEAAVQVARAHLGECKCVSLEAAPWMKRETRIIYAELAEPRQALLH